MDDIIYMKEAIAEARRALECGEIPVGAVIVRGGEIIGRGHNTRSRDNSPLGHAELTALEAAAAAINSWRFDGCSIYVTLEPCVMCSGALVQCRMGRIVFGAKDPRAGGCRSLYEIPSDPRMYHRCAVSGGLLADECAELLRMFFRQRRGAGRGGPQSARPAAGGR
ncbi:MAG: tRNA adenosine(34) deaminase TadA [Synergistaceae bacterium]|nr:tRNA adenosine(34) deaminase TadA [Synergistaceae bacterium]